MIKHDPCAIRETSSAICHRGTRGCVTDHPEGPWRSWWVFYIDPNEPQGSGWQTAGSITGLLTADEAIMKTAGLRFPDQPFWAFALDKGNFGAFYELHNSKRQRDGHLGPAGYVAERSP